MLGARGLIATIALFVAGLAAALVAMNQYADAYAWVAHTSEVRTVIGRAIGHAEGTPACLELRGDLVKLEALTKDNPVQQRRIPGLHTAIEQVCASASGTDLLSRLVDLDATERTLMAARRTRLDGVRTWVLFALSFACMGAIASVSIASLRQRRAMRALAMSEERFRMLASTSRDLIRVHDAAGVPTYVSPSVTALLGYSPAEFLTLPPLSLGHPDDAPRMRQALATIQIPHAPGTTLVYRLRARDGGWRWFETHTNPVHDEAGVLVRFYTTARDITDRTELEKKLEQAATCDELTGLLNRRGFYMLARQQHLLALRTKLGLGMVFADLDGLKVINDQLGHDEGDGAIRRLAEVLRSTFRESDVMARLGGDEFAILVCGVDEAQLTTVIGRFEATLARAAPIGPYRLAVSVGTALLSAGGHLTLDELIAQADRRMYESKRERKQAAPTAGVA